VPNFDELQNKIVEEYVLGCNKFWNTEMEIVTLILPRCRNREKWSKRGE